MVEKIAAIVTSAKMAQLLGFSRSQFERISAAGGIKPRSPNCWPVIETFQGFLRYARGEYRRTTKTAMRSRVQAARAREIELRIAERSHKLVDIDEAYALLDDVFGGFRSDLGGLPATVTRDLNIRRDIERGVNEILNRTAKRLASRVQDLRATGEVAVRPITLDA